MIFLWIYIAGYVVLWRNHVGHLAWSMAMSYQKELDGDDWFFGLFFGSMAALLWPLTVPGYIIYRLARTYTTSDQFNIIAPKPKPIETKAERNKRQERERAELIRTHQRTVNEKERELGMPLTKWDADLQRLL